MCDIVNSVFLVIIILQLPRLAGKQSLSMRATPNTSNADAAMGISADGVAEKYFACASRRSAVAATHKYPRHAAAARRHSSPINALHIT